MSTGNPDEAFGLKKGDRIKLVKMGEDDPCPVLPGSTGEVIGFCTTPGLEQVWIMWDLHVDRSLNLIPGVDEWEKIDDE